VLVQTISRDVILLTRDISFGFFLNFSFCTRPLSIEQMNVLGQIKKADGILTIGFPIDKQ